ncbi:unnamed protein product [Rotaria sordida]|uniref:Uncharacterized protein n=1 Tax=Rotaria sordida TaxID=392033 RepID=A0A818XBM4_9BILA|nr:unnamed protein product [Rotaria sordida]CAF3737308.1 unnamed protein product [Rotaria sordida]
MNSDYYNQSNDYSMNNKVKYLTPKIYRLRHRTQSPTNSSRTSTDNETLLNKKKAEYALTPLKYRLRQFYSSLQNHNKNEFNQYQLVSTEDIDQNNNERFNRESPFIMGDFILTEKPIEDHTMYNYEPKHQQISYIYKGTLTSAEVQERALNNTNQLFQQQRNRTLLSNSIEHEKFNSNIPTISNNIDDHRQSSIDNNEFSSIVIPSSNITLSPINNNSIFYGDISSNSDQNNSNNTSIKPNSIYYFGPESKYSPTNNEENYCNEDEICVSFGRNVEPKPVYTPPLIEQSAPTIEQPIPIYEQPASTIEQPIYEQSASIIEQSIPIYEQPASTIEQSIPIYEQPASTIEQPIPIYEQPTTVLESSIFTTYVNYNNNNSDDLIFQEVRDVGTSTDNISLGQELLNTSKNNRNSSFQKPYINNRESLFTNQSSRSETETYRVNQQTRNFENNDEIDINQFSPIENPTHMSSSNSSTTHSYTNLKKSTNYKMDTVSKDQSSEILYEEEEEEEEESHRSTSKSSLRIQKLVETNPLNIVQRTEYENLSDNSEHESSLSQKLNKTHQSRRNLFNILFRRGKKNSKSNKNKYNGKKKHKT